MNHNVLATFREILLPSSGKVCKCVWYLCVSIRSKHFKVVSDWLTLVAALYGTILFGRPLWTQFDDVVVLAVVFFALLSFLVVLVSKYLVI